MYFEGFVALAKVLQTYGLSEDAALECAAAIGDTPCILEGTDIVIAVKDGQVIGEFPGLLKKLGPSA